jgi:hypothetical protein
MNLDKNSGKNAKGNNVKDKPIIIVAIGIKSIAEKKLKSEYLLKKNNDRGREIIDAERDADINSLVNTGTCFIYGKINSRPAVIPKDSVKVKIKPGFKISVGFIKIIKTPEQAITL